MFNFQAKGFDRILELQQAYRDATGSYFAMDLYGGGNDEKAIRRAFFGRHGSRRHIALPTSDGGTAAGLEVHSNDRNLDDIDDSTSNERVKEVFARNDSLRKQLFDNLPVGDTENPNDELGDAGQAFSVPESLRTSVVLAEQDSSVTTTSLLTGSFSDEVSTLSTSAAVLEPSIHDEGLEVALAETADDPVAAAKEPAPVAPRSRRPQETNLFHILGDLSGKTVTTGVETAEAGLQLMENVVQSLFGGRNKDLNYNHLDCSSSSSSDNEKDDARTEDSTPDDLLKTKTSEELPQDAPPAEEAVAEASETGKGRSKIRRPNPFGFVPPRARFKWRRHPLPARFLGVQDHIVVRGLPQQKVFLNMSVTEVLCTTTAEALAMGKFVVIPKHPSNEFFYDFPNCLVYEDVEDCVGKMKFALSSTPEPLSPHDSHRLSWEGATERLYRAARVSVAQDKEYKELHAKEDEKAARLHVEGTTHSNNLRNFLNNKLLFDL